jgi:hypothetical protein
MDLPETMEKHGLIQDIADNSQRLDPELQGPANIVKIDGTTEYTRRDGSSEH